MILTAHGGHIMDIFCENQICRLPAGSTAGDVWRYLHGDTVSEEAVLAENEGAILDFQTPLPDGASISWVSVHSKHGHLAYQRTLIMLLVCAVRSIYGPEADIQVKHSLGNGLYCRFPDGHIPLAGELARLEKVMRAIAEEGRPIRQVFIQWEDALCFLKEKGRTEEAELLARHPCPSFRSIDAGILRIIISVRCCRIWDTSAPFVLCRMPRDFFCGFQRWENGKSALTRKSLFSPRCFSKRKNGERSSAVTM